MFFKSKKKLTIVLLFLLIGISAMLSFHYFINIPKNIATDMWAFKFPDKYEEYTTIKCSLFDPISPEYAFIDKMPERDLEIMFYNVSLSNLFNSEAGLNYTGGTDVKNTTFPELVKMVKEDCEQFKDGHASDVEGGPEWIYTRAQTEEEKIEEIRSGFIDKANKSSSFKEIYGDIDSMTNKEILILKEEIDKEGLNEKIHVEIEALRIRNKLYRLTDEQMEKVKERYGDLSELSDEELVEKDKQITADWESGDFVLD